MKNFPDIPKPWRQALALVQAVFPEARIVGGALRDLHHMRPVCDLDIFVPTDLDAPEAAHRLRTVLYDWSLKHVASETHARLRWVLAGRILGMPVDVVAVPEGADLPTAQDIGLCQITYDGEQVRATEAYRHDAMNRTLTVVRENAGSPFHYQKIRDKYPGHQLVRRAA